MKKNKNLLHLIYHTNIKLSSGIKLNKLNVVPGQQCNRSTCLTTFVMRKSTNKNTSVSDGLYIFCQCWVHHLFKKHSFIYYYLLILIFTSVLLPADHDHHVEIHFF